MQSQVTKVGTAWTDVLFSHFILLAVMIGSKYLRRYTRYLESTNNSQHGKRITRVPAQLTYNHICSGSLSSILREARGDHWIVPEWAEGRQAAV